MPNKINWNGSEAERVWGRVTVLVNGCWEWTGHTVKGYGRVKRAGDRKTTAVHVWVYETYVGPIPLGHQLDHLCRNKRCVNPLHLEPVTGRVNTLRGVSPAAVNAQKKFCKSSHPLSGDNVKINSRGHRVCVICTRAFQAAYRHNK